MYLLAFFTGLTIDLFSENAFSGIHAFSTLFMTGIRERWVTLTTSGNFRTVEEISLYNQSYRWYALFLLPLIFIHHTAFFLLENFSFINFGYCVAKIIASTLYTFIISYMITLIFYKRL